MKKYIIPLCLIFFLAVGQVTAQKVTKSVSGSGGISSTVMALEPMDRKRVNEIAEMLAIP